MDGKFTTCISFFFQEVTTSNESLHSGVKKTPSNAQQVAALQVGFYLVIKTVNPNGRFIRGIPIATLLCSVRKEIVTCINELKANLLFQGALEEREREIHKMLMEREAEKLKKLEVSADWGSN